MRREGSTLLRPSGILHPRKLLRVFMEVETIFPPMAVNFYLHGSGFTSTGDLDLRSVRLLRLEDRRVPPQAYGSPTAAVSKVFPRARGSASYLQQTATRTHPPPEKNKKKISMCNLMNNVKHGSGHTLLSVGVYKKFDEKTKNIDMSAILSNPPVERRLTITEDHLK